MTRFMTDSLLRRRRRQILIAMAAALAGLLLLHNPSAGYQTTTIRYEPWPMPATPGSSDKGADTTAGYPCDPPTAEDRAALASQEKFLGQAQGQCHAVALGFFGWRSEEALLPYVATMRKLLAIGGAILFVGLSAIWVLGDPKLRQSNDFATRRETP